MRGITMKMKFLWVIATYQVHDRIPYTHFTH